MQMVRSASRAGTLSRSASETASTVSPDLVILDLQMPVMDGRTFYREFRQKGFRSPVVILSAYNAEGARQELGAEAALNKPFDPDRIGEVVRSLVGGEN